MGRLWKLLAHLVLITNRVPWRESPRSFGFVMFWMLGTLVLLAFVALGALLVSRKRIRTGSISGAASGGIVAVLGLAGLTYAVVVGMQSPSHKGPPKATGAKPPMQMMPGGAKMPEGALNEPLAVGAKAPPLHAKGWVNLEGNPPSYTDAPRYTLVDAWGLW